MSSHSDCTVGIFDAAGEDLITTILGTEFVKLWRFELMVSSLRDLTELLFDGDFLLDTSRAMHQAMRERI